MGKVRILQDRVANQIAAGEVIERPAAVVKELVENALDAGATRVEVEFRHGGRSLMRIEDDGFGMTRDDALLALERHATSKISEADDLNRLASFGFRGEALPSIASVSYFQLQTREAGAEAGTEIVVNGGKLVHVRECGRPVGTRIEVTHLFNSVPARRKFLKSDATESAHIIQTVRLYALAFPGTAFVLIEDGKMIFRSPKCSDLRDRISEIFGRQVAEGLVPLDISEDGMRLHGLIGKPSVGRSTRHEMITFINQRPVDSRTLNYALIESYHDSLPKGRYPVLFVFFEIEPSAVDVNVHPAKREVRFRSEPAVRGFVIRSMLSRLRELVDELALGATSMPSQAQAPVAVPIRPFLQVPANPGSQMSPSTSSSGTPVSLDQAKVPNPSTTWSRPVSSPPPAPTQTPSVAPREQVTARTWRFLGLAQRQLAIFETPTALVVLDRRAAHERVWFERLEKEFRDGAVVSQRLLLPVPLELDPVSSALLLDRLSFLGRHGFDIEEFGRHFYRISAVPGWMEPLDAESFVRDLLGAMREGLLEPKSENVARSQLARMAASKAVRLPEQPNEFEVKGLVSQLFACAQPLVSPSGKATFFELTQGEIGRRLSP